jgi:hypothetical protein
VVPALALVVSIFDEPDYRAAQRAERGAEQGDAEAWA